MFTSPRRNGYRGPGISPGYYEDDPVLLASMGDERIKKQKIFLDVQFLIWDAYRGPGFFPNCYEDDPCLVAWETKEY